MQYQVKNKRIFNNNNNKISNELKYTLTWKRKENYILHTKMTDRIKFLVHIV